MAGITPLSAVLAQAAREVAMSLPSST
jgi:hypothetical protein